MKYIILLTPTLLFTTVTAQSIFDIDEQTTYVDGTYTGAIALDMRASKDEAKKAWNNYIQDHYDVDVKGYGFFRKKDKLKTDPITMTFLSDEKLILNTEFTGDETNTVMNIHVLKPDGATLSMDRDSMVINNLEVLTEEFVADFLPEYYAERVEKATDKHEDAVNELSDINEDIADKTKEIEDLHERIKELNSKRESVTDKVNSSKNSLMKKRSIYEKVKKKTAELN